MKRKILIVICIMLALLLFSLISLQICISHYNNGNAFYQNGEYESAIEEYEKALKGNFLKYERCKIRINYALALCETVRMDETDENSISQAIAIYESAINVLTTEGCANENDNNGHSQEAEQLKQDIQDEINRLKDLQEDYANDSDEKDGEEDEEEETTTEDVKSKIQDIKEEAIQDQRETESYNYGQYDFRDYNSKCW